MKYIRKFQTHSEHEEEKSNLEELGVYLSYCEDNKEITLFKGWQLGDVNHDGTLSVSDIMAISNYIQGNPPDIFYEKEADVNQDGTISVSDIQELSDKIIL